MIIAITVIIAALLIATGLLIVYPLYISRNIIRVTLRRGQPLTPQKAERLKKKYGSVRRYGNGGQEAYESAMRFIARKPIDYSLDLAPDVWRYIPETMRIESFDDMELFGRILNYEDYEPLDEYTSNVKNCSKIAKNRKFAVLCHGYHGSGADLICESVFWMQRGYNVLLPDMRGHGQSGGDYVGMGYHDSLDLLSWLNKLNALYEPSKIVLYGVSMGGATVLGACGNDLPGNVVCCIEDCAFASIRDEIYHCAKHLLFAERIVRTADKLCRKKYGYGFEDGGAARQLRLNTRIPVLFLHGDRDKFVPSACARELYDADACDKKRLRLFEGAAHAQSSSYRYTEYWQEIDEFLQKYVS